MIHYTNMAGDQYVPGNHSDIKMEDDESYYQNIQAFGNDGNDHNDIQSKMVQFFGFQPQPPTNLNMNFANRNEYLISTDESLSSISTEENEHEVEPSSSTSLMCVRGVRTITKNPTKVQKQNNGGIKKNRNRPKKTENIFPKEKDRAKLFNDAFEDLRRRIPSIPASKKLSKIEILRLAICYMAYLKFLLEPKDNVTNNNEIEQLLTNISEVSTTSSTDTIELTADTVELTADTVALSEEINNDRNIGVAPEKDMIDISTLKEKRQR